MDYTQDIQGGTLSKFGKLKDKLLQGPFLVFVGWGIFCVILFIAIVVANSSKDSSDSSSSNQKGVGLDLRSSEGGECNVVAVNLHGTMLTYLPEGWSDDQSLTVDERDVVSSDHVAGIIDMAEKDSRVKAIMLDVDSPGGSPVAGEEIADAIGHATKPVVGLIRQTGASAAYWAVSKTYPIYASKNSDIGGIGVTGSYLENIDKDKHFVQISSGKFKDSGNPNKPLTEEEKNLLLRDVKIIYDNFIKVVANNRNIKIDKVRALADGSTMLGVAAKSVGLIDEIGSIYDVKEYLETKIGEKPLMCWF